MTISYSDFAALPQDPFYPQSTPEGPSFLDTEACLCAIQTTPDQSSSNAVWQCIGNQTDGVYTATSGKWFNTLHGGEAVNGAIDDTTNGPDTSKPLVYDQTSGSLVPLTSSNQGQLSVYNAACTGSNQTTFSTAFYRADAELKANQTPVDAVPCYRPGAVPISIQNASNWQEFGCNEGFLCANNTVNSLPQFCPPLTVCQEARLVGQVCSFEGRYIGMGPFEPVVCQQGYYCPPRENGTKTYRCPKGSYCQPGCATPTPCSFGSKCPEGSQHQVFLIPIILLIIIDIILILGIILLSLQKRRKTGFQAHLNALNRSQKQPGGLKRALTVAAGYRALPVDNDHEMLTMDATYMPGKDAWTGFEAVLDIPIVVDGPGRMEQLEAELNPQLKAFVDSMRRATDAAHFGLSFQYSGLSFHPKGSPRPILQKVTGSVDRGSLVAVMGGSGAGKSTFVNVLMGKTDHTGGTVMINHVPGKIKRYKKLIGYVPQDDIVLPELTVYENILHSARIRLPRTWKDIDIQTHVNSVIDCLELSHVRDSLVGSVGKPVISGGQRKRVSIGMELAAAPMAIFLDEPTSGLDATAAASIMNTLKALARLGISVIVIIHQPRMEIFEILDNLILLGNGQHIYEGPQSGARQYFENIGFHFPDHANIGDVITDIITGNGRQYKRSGDISKDALISNWANSRLSAHIMDKHASMISLQSVNAGGYQDSNHTMHKLLQKRGAPRLKQLYLCLNRAILQQYRSKSAFWSEMILASLAGLLLGLAENSKQGVLFTGLYRPPFDVLSIGTDFQSAPGLALLIAIAIGLVSAAPGVRVFSEETLLQRREAEAGHSRLAYFAAKVLSVLPRMIASCLHFSTILFLLAVPIIPWGVAFVSNLVYFYCIYGLASVISMIMRREDAPLLATMLSLIVGILSGTSPPLRNAIRWHLGWLWRMSPGTWLAEIYFGQLVNPFAYLYDVDMAATHTGFHLDRLWGNIGVLIAIGTVYRVVAYLAMTWGTKLRV